MELFTSFYGNQSAIIQSEALPVRISLGTPRFPHRYELRAEAWVLMPPKELLQAPKATYQPAYIAKLEKMGVAKINSVLETIGRSAGKKKLVLLCYEDLSKDWCHRRMFADWWLEKTGQLIEELGMGVKVEPPPPAPKPLTKTELKAAANQHTSLFGDLL